MSIKCPICTCINEESQQRCTACYKHFSAQEWRCDDCLYWNSISVKQCSSCKPLRADKFLNVQDEGKRPKSGEHIGRRNNDKENIVKSHLLDVGPDRHKRSHSSDNRVQSSWNCCLCTFLNESDSRYCKICQHSRSTCCENITKNKWLCKTCQNFNLEHLTRCSNCSKKRIAEPNKKKDDTNNKSRITGQIFDNKPKKHDLRQSINSKCLRTIKTQLVERKWQNIVDTCRKTNSHFIDNLFPPNDNSLFKNPRSGGSNIQWLRLKDIMGRNDKTIYWKVYDKPRADDIKQGSIGNCWFICALAVVAERQQLVERIVVTKDYCKEGAYVVRLCKDGSWQTVVLDDYFPVDQNKWLKYSSAKRGQLWVPLIEKAAAKIHGCYEALGSGRAVESLALLTGEPCEHLSLTESKDISKTLDKILIWSKLTHARDCGYLMCTSCGIVGDGYNEDNYKSLGLFTQHAYSLLDVYDLETGEKLVKIRNPWGRESWNGDWSDDSSKWQKVKPEVKRKLKPEENKYGIFWMDFDEFRRYFNAIDICKVRDWHETRVKGSFPSSANGPWKFVKLYVHKKTDICLGLYQKNKRGSSSKGDFVDMLVIVMEDLKNGKRKTVRNSRRASKSYVGCDIEDLGIGQYIIACLAFKHLNGGTTMYQLDFVLTIHSTEIVVVEETDSVAEGYTHYLADTLIQLAVDEGKKQELDSSNISFSLSWDGLICVIENKDKKKYTEFQQNCTNLKNLMSSRGSASTQDVIPPRNRQVIILMSTIDSMMGSGWYQSMSYISGNCSTLEHVGDKTRQHNPDIPKELECLHQPRPII